MMRKFIIFFLTAGFLVSSHFIVSGQNVFDFENLDLEGWEIPDWALEQQDQVGYELTISDERTYKKSAFSLELKCDFPGDRWAAAVIEYNRHIDFSGYKDISCEIYVPRQARAGGFLQARVILVAGPWWWIEQRMAIPLTVGRWTTLEAKLDVTEDNQMSYWKRKSKDGTLVNYRDQVEKVIIRIEYNASERHAGPEYKGPIYIDDIKFRK
jgi:hypothetical protein